MPFKKVDDTNYYYEVNGQGLPLVLVAGYSCDHFFWDKLVAELVPDFQVWVLDNRAVGQTKDNGQALTLEMMAKDTLKLIQALEIETPTIIGQSMGGILAQLIAKYQPENIDNLIVLNSASCISLRALMALEGFVRLLQEKANIDTVIEASMPWFFSSEFLRVRANIDIFKESIINNPFPQSLPDLERQLHALQTFDCHDHDQLIQTPALIMTAEEDIICLPEESKALSEHIPQAQWVMLPGGHSSVLEVPKMVAGHIIQFLHTGSVSQANNC